MGHNRPDRPSLVEQHSPGLLADQKMLLLIGGDPLSAVTEAPRLDCFSLTPSRPGRGYGAGPAAEGGSTGLRQIVSNNAVHYRMTAQLRPRVLKPWIAAPFC